MLGYTSLSALGQNQELYFAKKCLEDKLDFLLTFSTLVRIWSLLTSSVMSKFPASLRSPMAAAVAIAADESILGVYIENLGRKVERKN